MARPRRHLALALMLLLGLLAGAAVTTGSDAQAACEPTTVATHVLRSCALDMPTKPCCALVLASVDHGGGVRCLFHVATQPQFALAGLNAFHLLGLYTACQGLRTGGAHLAAASPGTSTTTSPLTSSNGPSSPSVSVFTLKQSQCKAGKLGSLLAKYCDLQQILQSGRCCRAILTIVDSRDCLCYVAQQADFCAAELSIPFVWRSYKDCGGRRRTVPKNINSCHLAPPSPPPPPASPPPPPSRPSQQPPPPQTEGLSKVAAASIITGTVLITVISLVTVGVVMIKKIVLILKVGEPAPLPVSLPATALPSSGSNGVHVPGAEMPPPLQEFEQGTESRDEHDDPTLLAQVQVPQETREPRSQLEIARSTPRTQQSICSFIYQFFHFLVVTVGVALIKKIKLILKVGEPAPLPVSILPIALPSTGSEGVNVLGAEMPPPLQEFEQDTESKDEHDDPTVLAQVQVPQETRVWLPPTEPRSPLENAQRTQRTQQSICFEIHRFFQFLGNMMSNDMFSGSV